MCSQNRPSRRAPSKVAPKQETEDRNGETRSNVSPIKIVEEDLFAGIVDNSAQEKKKKKNNKNNKRKNKSKEGNSKAVQSQPSDIPLANTETSQARECPQKENIENSSGSNVKKETKSEDFSNKTENFSNKTEDFSNKTEDFSNKSEDFSNKTEELSNKAENTEDTSIKRNDFWSKPKEGRGPGPRSDNPRQDWRNDQHRKKPRNWEQRKGLDDPEEKYWFSRSLSTILRHKAHDMKLDIDAKGYVAVEAILGQRKFSQFNLGDVRTIVKEDKKQRFSLDQIDGVWKICANQGHSFEVEELALEEITDPTNYEIVAHGTYNKPWEEFIKHEGLSRMKRQYIHFCNGDPGDKKIVSGARGSANVLIYINMKKALADGYKFYRSVNDVILCPGNEDGVLPPQYFFCVKDRFKGHLLQGIQD